MTSSYHVAFQRCQEMIGAFFKRENAVFNGEHEKESISHVRLELKNHSLGITVCDQSASLVMSNGDPWDGFSYLNLTLVMDSYIVAAYGPILLTFIKNGCRL